MAVTQIQINMAVPRGIILPVTSGYMESVEEIVDANYRAYDFGVFLTLFARSRKNVSIGAGDHLPHPDIPRPPAWFMAAAEELMGRKPEGWLDAEPVAS